MKRVLGVSLVALFAFFFLYKVKTGDRLASHNGRPNFSWEGQGIHLN